MTAPAFAKDQLKAFIERIERLEEEKKATSDDIRDVYAEAKGSGFDKTALRTIIRLRKLDADTRREQEAILDTYMVALGMAQEKLPMDLPAMTRRVAESPTMQKAVQKLGTPVELTDEEKSQGVGAAFIKDGVRMTISTPMEKENA